MGVGGIDAGGGHFGISEASSRASTLRNVGSTAFNLAMTGGSVAAGVFGGPAGSAAVSALRDVGNAAIGQGAAGGGGNVFGDNAASVGNVTGAIQDSTQQVRAQASLQAKGFSDQMLMFELQRSVQNQSEAFNTLTNITKSKHDATMAAVQNTK